MMISKDEKKELQAQYKLMRPQMGLFAIIKKADNKTFLETTHNLKSTMNSCKFMLNFGQHLNVALQKDWQSAGPNEFETKILQVLEYDKDELKTDYTEELTILKTIWIEKLSQQGIELY